MFDFELVLGQPADADDVRGLVEQAVAARPWVAGGAVGLDARVTAITDDGVRAHLASALGADPTVWVMWGVDNKVLDEDAFDDAVRALVAASFDIAQRTGARAALVYASERLLLTRDGEAVRVYPGLLEWVTEEDLAQLGVPYERTDDEGWL